MTKKKKCSTIITVRGIPSAKDKHREKGDFMKKNLEKIFASCSIVVAFILIMVLVVTAFGGIETQEFESKLVKGLVLTLATLYIALAVVSLVLIFVNSDVVKEITLRQEKGGSIKVSSNVITKLVKNTCKQVEGVNCQKVSLVSDEYGVRLKLNVKVVDKDVVEAETYVRTLLEETFLGEFGFKFSSIEVKVMALTPHFKVDQADVNEKVEKKLAELKAEQVAADAKEAKTEPVTEEAVAEEVANAEESESVQAEESVVEESPETVEAEEIGEEAIEEKEAEAVEAETCDDKAEEVLNEQEEVKEIEE